MDKNRKGREMKRLSLVLGVAITVLVAACSQDGQMVVNPPEFTFGLGDEMVVIARGALKIEDD